MSPQDERAHGVHFVVRHNGKLHITNDSYVYDPDGPDLTAEDRAAIEYLRGVLGHNEITKLDNHRLIRAHTNGYKVQLPSAD